MVNGMKFSCARIRNFVIIAHIDHGKSTLADRFLEITGTIEKRVMKEQYLDQLESERERGITIKMAPVRMLWHPLSTNNEVPANEGIHPCAHNSLSVDKEYILNLIDTPGHSDFSYEVSRALAAVEGALLLVDGTQGIQAQTLANFENARRAGLTVIGAVNKIDMNPLRLEEVLYDVAALLGEKPDNIMRVSARTGQGVEELLHKIIQIIPPPTIRTADVHWTPDVRKLNRALIFDSLYDEHKGIIAFVRVFEGEFKRDDTVRFLATNIEAKIKEVGYCIPQLKTGEQLNGGEIGYIATGIKNPDKLKIGDTIIIGDSAPLPGYKNPQPVMFVSFYPENPNDYDNLKQALIKLRLTDAALYFEPESSEVLGRGFKGGFLGHLHFEITAERLEKEFRIATVHSFPSVEYRVKIKNEWRVITSPKDFPQENEGVEEPLTRLEIITPPAFMGSILSLKETYRLGAIETKTIGTRLVLSASLPLADLMSNLDDRIKSLSEGYASLSYEIIGWQKSDLEKVEILVAGHVIPGLTRILPKEKIEREARIIVERLRELLPREQFAQALQAVVRGRVIARETIPALKKDVGNFGKNSGDRTRKMKLWKKQQKGKVRLKERAEKTNIKIPASIFKELMKR